MLRYSEMRIRPRRRETSQWGRWRCTVLPATAGDEALSNSNLITHTRKKKKKKKRNCDRRCEEAKLCAGSLEDPRRPRSASLTEFALFPLCVVQFLSVIWKKNFCGQVTSGRGRGSDWSGDVGFIYTRLSRLEEDEAAPCLQGLATARGSKDFQTASVYTFGRLILNKIEHETGRCDFCLLNFSVFCVGKKKCWCKRKKNPIQSFNPLVSIEGQRNDL